VHSIDHLIIGAGVSGLATANFLPPGAQWEILEREAEPGGYCRTVQQDGFVWDYSGHFFHFRQPEVEAFLVERMADPDIRKVTKRSRVLHGDRLVDFPFQKNIHQLPRADFMECLRDLVFRDEGGTSDSFEEMLYARLGRSITEMFLKPYNEKLYACALSELDADAMGRFFPHANLEDIVRNMSTPDNESYNTTFTYPSGGAIQYIEALLHDLDPERIHLGESLESVDLANRIAHTNRREIRYNHLISSMPLPRLLSAASVSHSPELYTWNKVLVFNLGFDRKGWDVDHWVYVPDPDCCFYRVGFYDNIFDTDRMSLYVEIGLPADAPVDMEARLAEVLEDLEKCGIVSGHALVSHHSVVLNPAYVHVHRRGQEDVLEKLALLRGANVHSIGRYGGWKYCAIEDNIVEARSLAARLGELA